MITRNALAIVLAAGAAVRFGRQKLLADVNGVPMLERTIQSLLAAHISRVVVVLPSGTDYPTVSSLTAANVVVVANPDPSRGMFSSIQVAFLSAHRGTPLVILPGDMPFVRAATIAFLFDAQGDAGGIVMPRYRGQRGHPVVMAPALRAPVIAAPSDANLRDVLHSSGVAIHEVEVDDGGVVRDVDIRSDLEPMSE
ncbi:MAG: nucleotidyltransferase family protein [Vicinamibacterales bacterium]